MGLLHYDFDWTVLWREPYGWMLLQGIYTTIHLSLFAWLIAVLIGLIVAVLRVLPLRATRLAGFVYVQVFRNTPLLVQLFFWYFAAPLFLPKSAQQWLYKTIPNYAYLAGVVGLGLYTASRLAEQFRSGFLAIPEGLHHAARSTGLSTFQTFRFVIIPFAFRIIIPSFAAEFLTCFKNSALAMTIGVMETTHTAYYIDSFTWHGLETTTAASLVYLTIAMAITFSMAALEKRIRIPGMIARGR